MAATGMATSPVTSKTCIAIDFPCHCVDLCFHGPCTVILLANWQSILARALQSGRNPGGWKIWEEQERAGENSQTWARGSESGLALKMGLRAQDLYFFAEQLDHIDLQRRARFACFASGEGRLRLARVQGHTHIHTPTPIEPNIFTPTHLHPSSPTPSPSHTCSEVRGNPSTSTPHPHPHTLKPSRPHTCNEARGIGLAVCLCKEAGRLHSSLERFSEAFQPLPCPHLHPSLECP
jgi:hypothetical protein